MIEELVKNYAKVKHEHESLIKTKQEHEQAISELANTITKAEAALNKARAALLQEAGRG